MSNKDKMVLTPKWIEIKELFESNSNGSKGYGTNFPIDGKLDILTQHFVGMLGVITLKQGFDAVVEGIRMDLWKERIWAVIENAGLLPEVSLKDEELIEEARKDVWDKVDTEFDVDLDELEYQAYKQV
jgi:hypothetical protein